MKQKVEELGLERERQREPRKNPGKSKSITPRERRVSRRRDSTFSPSLPAGESRPSRSRWVDCNEKIFSTASTIRVKVVTIPVLIHRLNKPRFCRGPQKIVFSKSRSQFAEAEQRSGLMFFSRHFFTV